MGYADNELSVEACAQPSGYSAVSGDCDDAGADGFIWLGGSSVSVSGAVSPSSQTP